MTPMRIAIITGHYGVGKSECAIALARRFRANGDVRPVTLIDLDVVNPYFRSREARALLEAEGIGVIGNSLGIDEGVDLPAVPGTIVPLLRDRDRIVVIDLGGDPAGARALRQFRAHIPPDDTDVLCVINSYRPETATADRALSSLRAIEGEIGLPCTGIISNGHLLEHTTLEEVTAGLSLSTTLAARARIPIAYVAMHRTLAASIAASLGAMPLAAPDASLDLPDQTPPILVLDGVLRQQWMATDTTYTPPQHDSTRRLS